MRNNLEWKPKFDRVKHAPNKVGYDALLDVDSSASEQTIYNIGVSVYQKTYQKNTLRTYFVAGSIPDDRCKTTNYVNICRISLFFF